MKNSLIVVVSFFMLGFLSLLVRAEVLPDGVDLFIEAVRYRGGNHTLVHSLSYVSEQTYRIPPVSDEEIEKEAAEAEAARRKAFEGLDVKLSTIDVYRDHLRNLYSQPQLSRLTVKYKAPSFSRKLLSLQIERAVEGQEPSKWETSTHVIEGNVVSDKSESEGAVWFPQDRSAHVNETQGYMETLLNFGRLQGPPVFFMQLLLFQDTDMEKYEFSEKNIAKFKEERDKVSQNNQGKVLQTVGTANYDGNAKAYIVQSYAGDKVIELYWIDVARGFICPLVQYYDEKGKLLSEYKSENYFLHEKSGLWFPQVYEEMTTDRDGKQQFAEYHIDKSSLDVNFPIADDEFLVEITEGATVTDERKGKGSQRYKAIDKGILSLGRGGLDLENMNWLAQAEVSEVPSARLSVVQVLCLIAGILLILLGIYFRLHRKT